MPLSRGDHRRPPLVDGLPRLPTCGLAVTESERVLPSMIDQLEAELAKLGLASEVFTIRMTGCPNGCARPYNSDIGLVGKTKDKYTIFLGGRLLGDRLNFIYKDLVPTDEVVPTLVPVFRYFSDARAAGRDASATSAIARARTICWRTARRRSRPTASTRSKAVTGTSPQLAGGDLPPGRLASLIWRPRLRCAAGVFDLARKAGNCRSRALRRAAGYTGTYIPILFQRFPAR